MAKMEKCDGECEGTYSPKYQVQYVDGNIRWLCNECLKSMYLTSKGLSTKVSSVRRI